MKIPFDISFHLLIELFMSPLLLLLLFLPSVIFLVYSHMKSVSAPLRGDVILDCGFKQQEIPLAQEVAVEWRLQHRGKGWKVLEMKTRLDEAEGSAVGECCGSRWAQPLLVYPATLGESDSADEDDDDDDGATMLHWHGSAQNSKRQFIGRLRAQCWQVS